MKRMLLVGIGLGCSLSLVAVSFWMHEVGPGITGGIFGVILGLAAAAIFEEG